MVNPAILNICSLVNSYVYTSYSSPEIDLKMVQDLLQLSDLEWSHILETAAACGELLYLWGKKSNPEPTARSIGQSALVFQSYCEALPQSVYSKFAVRCRPFKKSSSDISGPDETFTPKLFCLDLKKC